MFYLAFAVGGLNVPAAADPPRMAPEVSPLPDTA